MVLTDLCLKLIHKKIYRYVLYLPKIYLIGWSSIFLSQVCLAESLTVSLKFCLLSLVVSFISKLHQTSPQACFRNGLSSPLKMYFPLYWEAKVSFFQPLSTHAAFSFFDKSHCHSLSKLHTSFHISPATSSMPAALLF